MTNYTDFLEEVSKIRVRLAQETEALLKPAIPPAIHNCKDECVDILTAEGTMYVETIGYDNGGVFVKTETGEVWDYMDLDTDDMVAIYDHVWHQINSALMKWVFVLCFVLMMKRRPSVSFSDYTRINSKKSWFQICILNLIHLYLHSNQKRNG